MQTGNLKMLIYSDLVSSVNDWKRIYIYSSVFNFVVFMRIRLYFESNPISSVNAALILMRKYAEHISVNTVRATFLLRKLMVFHTKCQRQLSQFSVMQLF